MILHLIGATTRSGLLTAPMRARFGINNRLEYYNMDVLSSIVKRSSDILDIKIDNKAANEIAGRSRGTPRVCNSLLRRVRDFAQIKGDGNIDIEITKYALKALNVDKFGLDEMDNKILTTLIKSLMVNLLVLIHYQQLFQKQQKQLRRYMNLS